MTWITPRPGRRASLRRRTRLGIAGVAVLAGLLGGVLAPSLGFSPISAAAAEENAEDPADAVVTVALAAGDHGRIAPGAGVTAAVTVTNGTEEEIGASRVTLEISRTPLTSPAALTAWLETGDAPASFSALGTLPLPALPPGEAQRTGLYLPDEELVLTVPGIYPLRAGLSGVRGPSSTARTVLVVADEGRQPEIAVLVPLTATPQSGTLLTATELTALTAPDGALTESLDAVAGSRAVLAVDPAILAAIRALGTSAPPSAEAWLSRLEALPNQRVLLQFGDADATVQARAQLTTLLQPTTLSPFLDPADFLPVPATGADSPASSASPSPLPSPSASPEAPDSPEPSDSDDEQPSLPSSDDLTALRLAETDVLWPRGDVSEADLAAFDSYLGGSAWTILPSTRVTGPPEAPDARGTHATISGHRVLIAESAASDILSRATATDDPDARDGLIAVALAHLRLSDEGRDGPLLVALDRSDPSGADTTVPGLAAVIGALERFGSPTTLDGLRQSPALELTLAEETGSAPGLPTAGERATSLQALLEDETRLRDFSSIIEDPALLSAPERIEILRLIAVGAEPQDFDDAVAAHRAATEETLHSVSVQPPSRVQLISSESDLPVWVRNGLPWPISVTLEARPSDGRLEVQRFTSIEGQGASNTRVRVPIEARVGSGEVTVRFALTSPTGVPIGSPQVANVTVRADWETIGISVFGGLIALLLAVGVVRTMRRRRREQRTAVADGETGADDTGLADGAGRADDAEQTDDAGPSGERG